MDLLRHQGHELVVARYESETVVHSASIECVDCYEIHAVKEVAQVEQHGNVG